MRKTALITGASSGIGYELSKVFAKNGYNLVLVSRNTDKLEAISEEIKKQHDIQVKVIPKDLCKSSAPQDIYDELAADGININVLVNNAGIGNYGKFTDASTEEHMDLIQLNITSLTKLCKLFGTDMVKSGSGRILNVASTAAFQAGPLMSTYYASKAYVLMFSEALKNEHKQDGVTVTVLCPGPTQTEFFKRNGMIGTKLEKIPHMMSAAKVAEIGFSGLLRGKTIVIPGLINKILVFSVRLAPRRIVTAIAFYLNQR
ncbi:SDR family oxidoreductase [Caldithrix abyssi]|nr:SDR family oxidoreductase [Caldithrix abyssi]